MSGSTRSAADRGSDTPVSTGAVGFGVGRGTVMSLAMRMLVAAALLIAVATSMRIGEIWTTDEGAVRAQVGELSEGSWSAARPWSTLDPEEVLTPIHGASIDGESFYPYTKQAVLPAILAPLRSMAGDRSLVALSIAGTILAAAAASSIARVIDPAAERIAFWMIVVLSPMLVYSFTVLGHTSAAALCGIVAYAAVARVRPLVWYVVCSLASVLAVLLRVEAVLYLVPLGVVLAVSSVRWREWSARLGIIIATSAITGLVANRFLDNLLGGPTPSEGEAILDVFRVIRGAFSSLLLVDFGDPLMLLAGSAMVGAIVFGVLAVMREPDNRALHVVFAVVSIVGSAVIAVSAPTPLGGLLFAFPGLAFGLVAVGPDTWRRRPVIVIAITSVLFVVSVFLTQERGGGGAQFGGRYLMVALPGLVAIAAVGVVRFTRLRARSVGVVLAAVMIASVVTVLDGLAVVREARAGSAVFADRLATLAHESVVDGADRPTILSTFTQIGRYGWRDLDDIDFVMVPEDDLEVYVMRFADSSLDGFGWFGPWEDVENVFDTAGFELVRSDGERFHVVERVEGR